MVDTGRRINPNAMLCKLPSESVATGFSQFRIRTNELARSAHRVADALPWALVKPEAAVRVRLVG